MNLHETEHIGWGKARVAGKTIATPKAPQPLVDWVFPWATHDLRAVTAGR